MADLQTGLERDARTILGLLRPIDRLRVLTLGYDVHQWLPWQAATGASTFTIPPFGRVSNIYDAIWLAIVRRPEAGRRHLVIALTDGEDWSSVMPSASLVQAARRAESVLHIVRLRSAAGESKRPWQWFPVRPDLEGQANLVEAAERTGGRVHEAVAVGREVVGAFEQAFNDFRQGYVLSYAYQGPRVDGWHDIQVSLSKPGAYSIRSRRGYFARH
jgi:VWFA-related protein